MKKLKYILSFALLLSFVIACTEDDLGNVDFYKNLAAPSDIGLNYNIVQDNSGLVTLTPFGNNASSYAINFGDGTSEEVELSSGEGAEHTYAEGEYEVTVRAYNINGYETIFAQSLVVSFIAPENLEVTAELDQSNPYLLNVSAVADYAASYLVYFDTNNPDEVPTELMADAVVSFEYPGVGDYGIKVVALSGGEETIETTDTITIEVPVNLPVDFEVFNDDVFFGFGGATAEVVDNPDIIGNDSDKVGKITKSGETWAGNVIQLSEEIDFTSQTVITMDVWSPRPGGKVLMKIENIDNSDINMEVEATTVGNSEWEQVSFDFSAIDTSQTYQKIVLFFDLNTVGDAGSNWTFYIDNIEQTLPSTGFDDGLLSNGDFEFGNTSWTIGGGDDLISESTIAVDGDNSYYSVDVTAAGNPWDVNMSQKVEIVQGTTYTLTFDAWSDVSRDIIAGIGLSADPWSSATETLGITTTKTTYSLTLEASDFGATDARVIFDLGADVGQVNIDNVSLVIGAGSIVQNGGYEFGNISWTIGGGDDLISTDNITNDGTNSYYSVDVTSAGNPWDVNMSQKLEIIQGTTYTLVFDAWSDGTRDIISGIGLSADPWSSATETISISTEVTTYTLTLESSDFGATDARVIFDLGADVGQVNIDNVYLYAN